MRAAFIASPNDLSIREVPYPEPAPGALTIRVGYCGVCGTDYHILHGDFLSPYPIIPGHEFAGIVDKVGDGVEGWSVGDRVAVDPSIFCGHCQYCLRNLGNHCTNWHALGNTVNGAMADYVAVPAKNVFVLPESISLAEGSLIEPAACVVFAMDRLALKSGSSVLLFGAGPMGMLLIQGLVHCGAGELTVVDISPDNFGLAQTLGATRTVLSAEMKQITDKFDVVIDATGIPSVIQEQFAYLAPNAKFLQFGVAPGSSQVTINPYELYRNDWTLLGTMAINNTFSRALSWVQKGRLQLKPIISRQISLADVPAILSKPKGKGELKTLIQF